MIDQIGEALHPSQDTDRGLFVRRGGAGDRLLVLLHGMGANASVWSRLMPLIDAYWPSRWIAPDLRGHGGSVQRGPYTVGMNAADIATLIADEAADSVTLVGHSFGGAIAAVVAGELFGVPADHVFAIGVKICWTAAERVKARDLAGRPAPTFTGRDQAIDRYLKISGLAGLIDPRSPEAAAGVSSVPGGYRVAMDPRAYGAVGPKVENLLRMSAAPLHLAAGANDPMVSLEVMRSIDRDAMTFAGLGHNVHVEAPQLVWQFIEKGLRSA
jgi:pimeloyl-ACP methyl ester carboxylesterase